ncbi:DinI-like family protein [Escherichia coli]|nr:DinI-like family protein [Escherichia coli]
MRRSVYAYQKFIQETLQEVWETADDWFFH